MSIEKPKSPIVRNIEKAAEEAPASDYDLTDLRAAAIEKDIEISAQDEEPYAVEQVDDLEKTVDRYYKRVLSFEGLHAYKSHLSADEYREQLGDLDTSRTRTHNALLSQIDITTRVLGGEFKKWHQKGVHNGGMAGGVDRQVIGVWALREAIRRRKEQVENE